MTNPSLPVEPHAHDTIPGFRLLQTAAFAAFAVMSVVIARDITAGSAEFGLFWALPIVLVAAYLAADLLSGFVHYLADNFGSPDTPILGKAFVLPFREHHTDPTGILRHSFMIGNGNNCLVTVPFLGGVMLAVPVGETRSATLIGAFALFLSLAILLTNQFHKWAHMDSPPRLVWWLQRKGLVLSKEHHDIHHVSPFDTHYCITVGWWNPLLQRIRFFETTTKVIRFFVAR